MSFTRVPGSFRDPAGQVLVADAVFYRRIAPAGQTDYRHLMASGLYDALRAEGLLVPHEDLGPHPDHPGAVTVIRPERIPMISYPYEWSFSQLRDAARVTLRVEQIARRFAMTLKDASAFNVQFLRGRPLLIDTLSFARAQPGPWLAYQQFCSHFLAPLALASTTDVRLTRLAQLHIDGVPLDLASRLLPRRSWLKPSMLMHVHLHAAAQRRLRARVSRGATAGSDRGDAPARTAQSSTVLVESLDRAVTGLSWRSESAWGAYYDERPSYQAAAFADKERIVSAWLERARPAVVWDLGANTGHFSGLAARSGAATVAFDSDAACVERLYRRVTADAEPRVLPLIVDLANPSAAIGWANEERMTLEQRGPADLVLMLAVIHHLAIGNNVPLEACAAFLARLCRRAIIEFVPKDDPMVRQMLAAREDIFAQYTADAFERAMEERFTIDERVPLTASGRSLYLLTVR